MAACLISGCPEDVPQTNKKPKTSSAAPDGGVAEVGYGPGPFHIRFAPDDGQVPYPMAGLLHDDNLWRSALPEMVQHLSFFASRGDGFPTTQILTLPFSQQPQLSTLTNNLLILDVATETTIEGEFSWHETRQEIIFTPTVPFAPGIEIQLFLRGGTTGIRSEEDETLSAPALFRSCMLEQREDADCSTFYADQEAQWVLAQGYGFSMDNLAFAYRVPITAHTEAQGAVFFNKGAFPDELHWQKEDGRTFAPDWLYPESVESLLADVRTEIETHHAFSLTGGIYLAFDNANNPTEITQENQSGLFFDDGTFQAHTGFERQYFPDEQLLYVRPELTLEPGETYVYRLANLTDRGLAVVPQERVAILTGPDILDEDGKIQVPGLSDDLADELVQAQTQLRPFVDQWRAEGLDPFSLSALGYFETLSASTYLNEHRTLLLQQELNLQFQNTLLQTPLDRGLWPLLDNVEKIYTGEATLRSWLDPNTRRRTEEMRNVQTEFVLTIPKDVADPSNIPVILFGHGVNTSAELAYGVANFLASAGYAVFAIDLPYHGMRSLCTEDLHCEGLDATCRGDGQCLNSDNTLGRVRKNTNLFAGGPQVAITTGTHFFEIDDIIATRDHFLQALLDQIQALRFLQNADWVTLTGYGLKTDTVSYLGISLGSILGASLSPIEPDIQNFALNVGGADVVRLLQKSTVLSVVLADFLREYDVEENDATYTHYTFFARWLLDFIDPINLVQHTHQNPLPGIPAKNALIQMCTGDLVVPNITTQLLSQRMNTPFEAFCLFSPNHAFLVDPTSIAGASARDQIVAFFNQNP